MVKVKSVHLNDLDLRVFSKWLTIFFTTRNTKEILEMGTLKSSLWFSIANTESKIDNQRQFD